MILRGRAEPALPKGKDGGGRVDLTPLGPASPLQQQLGSVPGNSSWGDISLMPLPLYLPKEHLLRGVGRTGLPNSRRRSALAAAGGSSIPAPADVLSDWTRKYFSLSL